MIRWWRSSDDMGRWLGLTMFGCGIVNILIMAFASDWVFDAIMAPVMFFLCWLHLYLGSRRREQRAVEIFEKGRSHWYEN
jgi:hypothetical protein